MRSQIDSAMDLAHSGQINDSDGRATILRFTSGRLLVGCVIYFFNSCWPTPVKGNMIFECLINFVVWYKEKKKKGEIVFVSWKVRPK